MRGSMILLLCLLIACAVSAVSAQPAKVTPAFYSGTGMPQLKQFTRTSTDPAKDQAIDHLDIVADYFCFSGSKFYVAIQNRGGGFPFSGAMGFPPYNSYMYFIANPKADPKDPKTIVWALAYMKVSMGGIKPGLYKITGKGAEDLIRLGDISTSVDKANNLLRMSCDISKLLADPDFKAWYDPANPVIGTGSSTSRTTLKGFSPVTKETDTSAGAWVYPQKVKP